jgi:hypothetical protein
MRALARPSRLFAALATGFMEATTQAADVAVDGSVQLQNQYSDNYLFSAAPHSPLLILALSPSLSLKENTEASNLRIDASATAFDVPRLHEDNHTDLNLSLAYSIHDERNTVGATLSYVKSLTVESEFLTSGVLLSKQKRDDILFAPSWSRALSERLMVSASLSAEDVRYPGPAGAGASAANYQYYQFPASLQYASTERDNLSLTLTTSLYRTDSGADRTLSEQIGGTWQHQLSESATLSASLGAFDNRTRTLRPFVFCPVNIFYCYIGAVPLQEINVNRNSSGSGNLINVGFDDRLSETLGLSAHAARQLIPSGFGGLYVTESMDAGLSSQLAENLSGGLKYSQVRTLLPSPADGFTGASESLSASLSWKIDEFSSIQAGLGRTNTLHERSGSPRIHGDSIFANYLYAWPESREAGKR